MVDQADFKVKITTTADTAGAKQAAGALDDVARKSQAGAAATGTAAQQSTKHLSELSQATGAATTTLGGLQAASEGGARGLLGAAAAGRSALNIFRLFSSTLAGPLSLAVGAAAVALAGLGKVAKDAERQMQQWRDADAKRAGELKQRLDETKRSAEDSLKVQQQEVAKLAAQYTALASAIDTSRKRTDELYEAEQQLQLAQIDQREQAAIARSRSPEEREAAQRSATFERDRVRDVFAQNRIVNTRLGAQVDRRAAEETIAQQFQLANEAQAAAAQAEREAEEALEVMRSAREGGINMATQVGAEIRANAATAKRRAEELRAIAQQIASEASATIAQAQQRIEEARQREQIAAIESRRLGVERSTRALGAQNDNTQFGRDNALRKAELEQQVRDAWNSGDSGAADAAQQELQRILAAEQSRAAQTAEHQAQLASGLKDIADKVASQPVDPAPVRESVIQLGNQLHVYQGAVLTTVREVASHMQSIGARVDAQAREIQNLRIQIANLRPLN